LEKPSARFIARSLELWKREPRTRGIRLRLHRGRLVLIVLGAALLVGLAILNWPAPARDAAGTRSP
jgi:hypothetical protein